MAHAWVRRRGPSVSPLLSHVLRVAAPHSVPPPPVSLPVGTESAAPRRLPPRGRVVNSAFGATSRVTWRGLRRCSARDRLPACCLTQLPQGTGGYCPPPHASPPPLPAPPFGAERQVRGVAAGEKCWRSAAPSTQALGWAAQAGLCLSGSWRDLRGEACAGREPARRGLAGRRERRGGFMCCERGRTGRLERRRRRRAGPARAPW